MLKFRTSCAVLAYLSSNLLNEERLFFSVFWSRPTCVRYRRQKVHVRYLISWWVLVQTTLARGEETSVSPQEPTPAIDPSGFRRQNSIDPIAPFLQLAHRYPRWVFSAVSCPKYYVNCAVTEFWTKVGQLMTPVTWSGNCVSFFCSLGFSAVWELSKVSNHRARYMQQTTLIFRLDTIKTRPNVIVPRYCAVDATWRIRLKICCHWCGLLLSFAYLYGCLFAESSQPRL